MGAKEANINFLCDHIEYISGINRETSLVGDFRHLPTLVDLLKSETEAMGSRGIMLRLPAKFEIYSLTESGGVVKVVQNFSKIALPIPQDKMLVDSSGHQIPVSQWCIEFPYSDAKATIKADGCIGGVLISGLGDFRHSRALAAGLGPMASRLRAASCRRSLASVSVASDGGVSGSTMVSSAVGSAESPRPSEGQAASQVVASAFFAEEAWVPSIGQADESADGQGQAIGEGTIS